MTKPLSAMHLHFDCHSGAAGDMVLGAFIDLGVPEDCVREALALIPIAGYELRMARASRCGLVGTDVTVRVAQGNPHDHQSYGQIRALLAPLPEAVRTSAERIFERVAVAEARLHGVPLHEVSFHEVGAVDSIVDVVGAAAALAWLAPADVTSTPVPMGHGSVSSAHGSLPVPGPAALEIARDAGMPVTDGGSASELLTPTGAAILATVVKRFEPMPPVRVRAVGYGAGDRDLSDRPNLLRAVIGEPLSPFAAEDLYVLEANLDDMAPELAGWVCDRLLGAGALDVWWTPATMKKSRPGFVLGALAPAGRLDLLANLVLSETTSLGVRWSKAERRTLERRTVTVATSFGPVQVKIGSLGGKIVNVAPEYESCRAVAAAQGVPLKEVYAAAACEYRVVAARTA